MSIIQWITNCSRNLRWICLRAIVKRIGKTHLIGTIWIAGTPPPQIMRGYSHRILPTVYTYLAVYSFSTISIYCTVCAHITRERISARMTCDTHTENYERAPFVDLRHSLPRASENWLFGERGRGDEGARREIKERAKKKKRARERRKNGRGKKLSG